MCIIGWSESITIFICTYENNDGLGPAPSPLKKLDGKYTTYRPGRLQTITDNEGRFTDDFGQFWMILDNYQMITG